MMYVLAQRIHRQFADDVSICYVSADVGVLEEIILSVFDEIADDGRVSIEDAKEFCKNFFIVPAMYIE